MRLSRPLAATGVRLAIIQAILLVSAFLVAGAVTKATVKLVYRQEQEARIQLELRTLEATQRERGRPALVQAVNAAARRPGGLQYRLVDAAGRQIAGDLPYTGVASGWAYLDWDDEVVPGRPYEDLLVYAQPLADGSVLTVGRDRADEARLRHAVADALNWCGLVGGGLALILSWWFTRGALRRVDGVMAAARAVSQGRMQVRAPTRRAILPDDIDALGETFNGMLDEIAGLVDCVRWISTDIAHDLRTPITHVRQKLEQIKDAADPEARSAAIEIEADVDEILRTFDAMLRLAEIENTPGEVHRAPIDLAELAGRIADAYRPDIEASGRHLDLDLTPVVIQGEADLLAQAIANLMENALRHTPVGAHIGVRAGVVAGRPALSVTDNGAGIPPAQRAVVLKRFQRLDVSRSSPGSGLGLAIVLAIARRHGASLELGDAGPGLRVQLLFPGG